MYEHGQRVELVHTNDPHTRLRPGDHGTVTSYDPKLIQLNVDWDSGSRLAMLLADGDEVRILPPPAEPPPAGDGGTRRHGHHEYATVHLADGRVVDVFTTGTVQVYFDNLRHAYEFTLPTTTPTDRDHPIRFLRLA